MVVETAEAVLLLRALSLDMNLFGTLAGSDGKEDELVTWLIQICNEVVVSSLPRKAPQSNFAAANRHTLLRIDSRPDMVC